MGKFERMQIKSFKHNGHIHRIWQENWLMPADYLDPRHASEAWLILINSHTRILESNGQEWVSRIPAVSFFIPEEWYNIVALMEDTGIRYYCNIASPPYRNGSSLTYIDYDLDVIVTPDGLHQIVDEGEYHRHKSLYHYSEAVQGKVQEGLDKLIERIDRRASPFSDALAESYFARWKEQAERE